MLAADQLALEERVVRAVVRRHVPLDAVEHVVIAVPPRGRLDRVHVGTGPLLGDRVALAALAPGRRPDVPVELVLRRHLGKPGRRGRDHPGERVGHPADLLLDQHLLHRRAPAAAVGLGQVRGVDPEFDRALGVRRFEVGRQLAVRQLDLDLKRNQLIGERPGPRLHFEILLRQVVHPSLQGGLNRARRRPRAMLSHMK